MTDNAVTIAERAKAKEEMVKSVRDLLGMKVTLPLGNPALKQVHTNQFCWIELPPEFELANFKEISKAMDSNMVRYSAQGYDRNRWYIEGVTITCDGDTFDMELELNPFASSLLNYRDERLKWIKTYTDAQKQTTTQNNTNTNTNTNNVKSVGTGNTTLKGGQGKVIDDLAKKAVGNETRPYWKAVAVHKYLKKFIRYGKYSCSRYRTAEQCWKHHNYINCADTARLTTAVMRSAGLDAYVVWAPGHFWTAVYINGKRYYSDLTGATGCLSIRNFGEVWHNMRHTRKEGASPHC